MPRARGLWFCVWLSLCALSGCRESKPAPGPTPAPAPTPVKTAPKTPLAEKTEDLGRDVAWTPAWDAYIEQNLPADLLSEKAAQAVHAFCPAFPRMPEVDKRQFWAYTFQALSAAEAGLRPTVNVHHSAAAVAVKDSVTQRSSRQAGLLQLKYQDAERYGCDFDYAADRKLPEGSPERTILQPRRNLACGFRIMENQLIEQNKPLLTRSSYWATLQPGTGGYRVFAKQMANVPEACGVRQQAAQSHHPRRKRARSGR